MCEYKLRSGTKIKLISMTGLCGKTIEGLGNLNITLRELNMHRKLWKTRDVEIFREVLRCEL